MQGVLTAVVGLIALFVPALREVDTAYLIELIWDNLDHVEAIITAVGALATAAGTVWGMFGAVTAKAPVDPMLVARVRGRDVRLPARGVRKPAGPTRLESVPGDRASDGEYWRHPRGPFDPE
ncbi:MAG: hypothetical protein EOM22_14145 [Gammaproteobacteria bacterium]|nr:hypothetical protein [Gammaproteobacteria bacterium]